LYDGIQQGRCEAREQHTVELESQFYGSFNRPEELLHRYRDLMIGVAALKFLAGFCYTQLTDIEQEINGLLSYDRQPKVDADSIAQIHRDLFEERYLCCQRVRKLAITA